MDPNIVASGSFGLLWHQPFNTNEQVSMIQTSKSLSDVRTYQRSYPGREIQYAARRCYSFEYFSRIAGD
jgi:hypothetical protein